MILSEPLFAPEVEALHTAFHNMQDEVKQLRRKADILHFERYQEHLARIKAEKTAERLRDGRQRDDEYIQELNDENERLRADINYMAQVDSEQATREHHENAELRREVERLQALLEEACPPEGIEQDEQGGCVWCGSNDHMPDCAWVLARRALEGRVER
jgi:hypothetical protein